MKSSYGNVFKMSSRGEKMATIPKYLKEDENEVILKQLLQNVLQEKNN